MTPSRVAKKPFRIDGFLLRDTENDREIIQIYFCEFRTRAAQAGMMMMRRDVNG